MRSQCTTSLIVSDHRLCHIHVQRASSKGLDFIENTGFTRADLQGCFEKGKTTFICRGCWAKSLRAKEAWLTALHFKTFDGDAKKERKARINLSDEVLVRIIISDL